MVNRKLDLTDVWVKCERFDVTLQQAAALIAEKIRNMPESVDSYVTERREDIADAFDELAEDDSMENHVSWFNSVLEDLYEWGDSGIDHWWNGEENPVEWAKNLTGEENYIKYKIRTGKRSGEYRF